MKVLEPFLVGVAAGMTLYIMLMVFNIEAATEPVLQYPDGTVIQGRCSFIHRLYLEEEDRIKSHMRDLECINLLPTEVRHGLLCFDGANESGYYIPISD